MIYPDIIGTKDSAAAEVRLRQELVQVALGRSPADLVLRVGRLLNVHAAQWLDDWEIVIKGERIAWTGPGGQWRGETARRVHHPDLHAAPGFGEHVEFPVVREDHVRAVADDETATGIDAQCRQFVQFRE